MALLLGGEQGSREEDTVKEEETSEIETQRQEREDIFLYLFGKKHS